MDPYGFNGNGYDMNMMNGYDMGMQNAGPDFQSQCLAAYNIAHLRGDANTKAVNAQQLMRMGTISEYQIQTAFNLFVNEMCGGQNNPNTQFKKVELSEQDQVMPHMCDYIEQSNLQRNAGNREGFIVIDGQCWDRDILVFDGIKQSDAIANINYPLMLTHYYSIPYFYCMYCGTVYYDIKDYKNKYVVDLGNNSYKIECLAAFNLAKLRNDTNAMNINAQVLFRSGVVREYHVKEAMRLFFNHMTGATVSKFNNIQLEETDSQLEHFCSNLEDIIHLEKNAGNPEGFIIVDKSCWSKESLMAMGIKYKEAMYNTNIPLEMTQYYEIPYYYCMYCGNAYYDMHSYKDRYCRY